MSFNAVLQRAKKYQFQTVAESSESTYHSYLQLYEESIAFYQTDLYHMI